MQPEYSPLIDIIIILSAVGVVFIAAMVGMVYEALKIRRRYRRDLERTRIRTHYMR